MNLGNRIGLALAGLALLVATPLSAEDAAYDLDIESQPLAAALKEFAEQSGLQVVYYSKLADGEESSEVSGAMTADQAMMQLLASTGLTFDTMGDDTVVIEEAPAQAESEVTSESGNVRPTPSAVLMAQASTNGREYRNEASRAQEGDSSPAEEEVERLEEIIVTGTNIRGVQNPTTPVLTFDRKDIELSGASTVEDFLRTIPQNFGQTSPIGQDSANDFNQSSNFTNGTAIDLRGLGAGTTLTLLNGRRMTVGGVGNFVDVSLLPLGAIERVDVLTDGASAVYGTDAVAGAVNFVTRKDFDGFDFSGRYGTVTDGSREEYSVGSAAGHSWGQGGIFLGVEYVDQQPLLATERDFFDSDRVNADGTVGAESERVGAIASLHQDFTDKLSFAVDALYSNRESGIFRNFQPQVRLGSDQEAFFVNSRLSFDLTESVTASIYHDYGREDSSQVNSAQPGEIDFFVNDLQLVEAQLSGSLFELPSGTPLSFAIGGVYRDEKNEQSDNIGTAIRLLSRDVYAAYAELLIPILGRKNELPFLKAFDLSIAGRYEDYSDFGDTFNPKIGVHLVPHSDVTLRASYSTAFRAPTLFTIGQDEGVFIVNVPNFLFTAFPAPGENGTTPVINFPGGNPNLGEERADVWSGGLELTPSVLPGLVFSTTYFSIDYEDRIERVSLQDLLQDPAFSGLVDLDPDPAFVANVFSRAQSGGFDGITFVDPTISPEDIQVIINAGTQNIAARNVDGLDVNIEYEIDTDLGVFAASVNLVYLLTYDGQFTELSNIVDQLDVIYRPVDLKLRGGLTWARDGLTVAGFFNHTGGYVDHVDRSIANGIDSWTTVDLAVSYDTSDRFDSVFLDGARVSLNIRNALDEDPPFVLTLDGFNYDTSNADPYGRFVSVSFSKTF